MIDWFLAHLHLIPEDWKGKTVFFWGTIYRADGNLGVRAFYWDGASWVWDCNWIGNDWRSEDPAAVPA